MELMGSPKKGKVDYGLFGVKKAKKLKRDISRKVNSMEDGLFWDNKGKRYSGTKINYEISIDENVDKDRLGKYLVLSP